MDLFQTKIALFEEKMHESQLPDGVIEVFKYYYAQLFAGQTGFIHENEIKPVTKGSLARSENLGEFSTIGRELLPQTVHIVLNGGLGTSMGLLGPKSLLRVKNGKSFLEIITSRSQLQGINLAFMNSFNTEKQTIDALLKLESDIKPFHFMQNRFPKVCQKDLAPVRYHKNPELEWNPPGHGDIYVSLYASGLLDEFLARGIKYAFISNVDNLRAFVVPEILGYFAIAKIPFMMEVASKTPTDVKGGHLAESLKNKSLVLRELAQCPPENHQEFLDLQKYPLFNTNNIWLDLDFLHKYIQKNNFVPLPIIINCKTVDYRNKKSAKVYQIESAMGAAINIFRNASALHVPRSRLLAVKTCNDLLTVRSDCFRMDDKAEIYMAPERISKYSALRPQVNLDERYFSKIDDFEKRFNEMPSLLNCESLKIQGDFCFESKVTFTGNVTLVNSTEKQIIIKSGSAFTGTVIF